VKKGLWEKFPQPNRVRCRELIVELLRAVALARQDTGREDERKA
jgi:hypothetical protein